MWQVILIGDILVMGFMVLIVMLVSFKEDKQSQNDYMKIPLEDS